MIADDEAPLRMTIRKGLAAACCNFIDARNGLETIKMLEAAARLGEPIDVVFLDIGMTARSGADVIKHLEANADRPAVIIMIGGDATLDVLERCNLKNATVICKPFGLNELASAVTRIGRDICRGEG